jgi:hypothetical protein
VAGGTSSLTWNLFADASGYVSGMNRAKASTAQFKKELEKAERSQRSMTRYLVAGAAVAAVTRFGVQSVKAYAEAEKAQARLSEAYRKFPKLANANIASLRALNSELQKKTRFDDDQTAAAQASLAQYDLTGQQIKSLTPLVQDLATAMGVDVTDAAGSLGKAFLGNTRALKAVGIDFKATGDRGKDFTAIMAALQSKVGGFAEAEGKTASGQLAILNNTFGDLQESVGEALIPALNQLVQTVTPVVRAFTDLPAPVRTTALAVTAFGAAALLAAPKVLALKTLAEGMGKTSFIGGLGKGATKFAVIATAAAAATKAVSMFGDQSILGGLSQENLQARLLDTSKSLDDLTYKISFGPAQEIGNFNQALETMIDPGVNNQITGFIEGIVGIDGHLVQSTKTVQGMDSAIAALAQGGHLPEAKTRFEELRASWVAGGKDGAAFDSAMVNAREAISAASAPTGALTSQTKQLADVWHDAEGNLKSFGQALKDLNSPARDLSSSQLALVESAKQMAEGLRKQGTSFSLATQAGRDNRQNLIDLTAKIEEYGAAVETKTGSIDKARKAVLRERDALVDNLVKTGLARDRAQELVDKYLKVPSAAKKAADAVNVLKSALDRIPANKAVTISLRTKGANILASENKQNSGSIEERAARKAGGGLIRGPGSGTSDSIPARVSNGEYVVRARAVQRYGPQFFHDLNAERYADGGLVDTGFGDKGKKSSKAKAKAKARARRSAKARAKSADYSIRDSLRDGAALDFDFSAYGQAVERAASATKSLADADTAVFEARRKVNQAGSPAERADAERDLADALTQQAEASKEVTAANKAKDAAKPTGRNILAGFKARAAKLDKFRRDLKTLKSWGLSGVILKQLVDSGIDDGGDMAAALVKDRSVIAELNSTQRSINADSTSINGAFGGGGGSTGGSGGGGGSTGTTGSTSAGVVLSFADASKPVVLKMDSEHVWKGLLSLKKSKGGAKLHLD